MKMSILGDSISTFKGWIPAGYHWYYPRTGSDVTSVDKTWWHLMCKEMGLEIDTVNSFSGSRITDTNVLRPINSHFSSPLRFSNLGDPDILFLYGGVNDYASDFNPPSLEKFSQAYKALVSNLKALYPRALIVIMTPLMMFENPETRNAAGVSLVEIRNLICETAKSEGLICIDLFLLDPSLILTEDLHPSAVGMKRMSDFIRNKLRHW